MMMSGEPELSHGGGDQASSDHCLFPWSGTKESNADNCVTITIVSPTGIETLVSSCSLWSANK